MHISDFDYALPPDLIASEPVRPRDASRMMTLGRHTGHPVDAMFSDLPELLKQDDILVINDTRVMKARMLGVLERASGTSRSIEVLFANPLSETVWEVMCKPGKRIRNGDRVSFDDGKAVGTFGEEQAHGLRLLSVESDEPVLTLFEHSGHIPLPPYINRPDQSSDAVEYQTVFATHPGAVAAPTAGLHFTSDILNALERRGIDTVSITLHVGVGTFLPIREDDPRKHVLKPEAYHISESAAHKLNEAKAAKRRIIAVGTTSTRTLEYVVGKHGHIAAGSGHADIYIIPGYEFGFVDGLLTNFHLPKSTLLLLVSAFASREIIMHAYEHAIAERYRFFSYGDCMLIL